MKRPNIEGIKGSVKSGASYARGHGEPIARQAIETGRSALKTKLVKRIATGALAGGAIAYAIPFAAVTSGAILGAGALVLFKSIRDKED